MIINTFWILCVFGLVGEARTHDFEWCYSESSCAPQQWPNHYSSCGGSHQSPIDLDEATATVDTTTHFELAGCWSYDASSFELENTGHSVQVNLKSAAADSHRIRGGQLPGTYQFIQFHFHFGSNNTRGSEHTRNGRQYPMEMHAVGYDVQYADFDDAKAHPDGLVVLSSFFEIDDEGSESYVLSAISDLLPMIPNPGDKYMVDAESYGFSLYALLPGDHQDYFWYRGSLTTPGCEEVVQWMVLREPILMSEDQISEFRTFPTGNDGDLLADNFRPTQPLNGRTVYKNF